MKNKTISQREARALQKRVKQLEDAERLRRNAWGSEWPGGVFLTSITMAEGTSVTREVLTARKLKHAVVAVPSSSNSREITLFAVPLEG